jgi:uncharacterized protein YjbI with pentapeptide repeats
MESTARLRNWVLLGLAVGALVSSLLGVLPTGDWTGLALNLGAEMAGALVTYLLLQLVIGRREWSEAKKAELIAQLGSSVKDVAIAAAEELHREGWLHDGSLQRANLWGANLPGANLEKADLQEAILVKAILEEACLDKANLQGAHLNEANLQGTALQGANLAGADLQGAILLKANLQGTGFDGNTILPDGTNWTPDTDINRLTSRKLRFEW